MLAAELASVAMTYPAIDNHAHPILKEKHRNSFAFEGLVSEASSGPGLDDDARQTLACYRATAQLGGLFNMGSESTWESIKTIHETVDYDELCRKCMEPTNIQCILLDDGLGGVEEFAEDYQWHNRFTKSPCKRIVRVEILAEDLLKSIINTVWDDDKVLTPCYLETFSSYLEGALRKCATDPEVVGFKSIACYRTGLDITLPKNIGDIEQPLITILFQYHVTKKIRLANKVINDFIVNTTLRIAGECGKPVQFHTGLGDNDIDLNLANPAFMQPIIKAYPQTKFVLLHSSYPYTREAGYLTATYENVFLDFGEIFPFLSRSGQKSTFKQVLELCPTNKILWSTDGHWWPESYYLGTIQAREVMYEVLAKCVTKGEMTEAQAIGIVKRALFENSNRIYNLGLTPAV